MTEKVTVVISKDKTVKLPTGIRMLVRRCCTAVLQLENFEGSAEVSVTFTDDERIRELNRQYRHIDASTDVLSFPLGEGGQYDVNLDTGAKQLGDIVISVPHAEIQAEEYGHGVLREICFLTVHSMLHLFGYDHEEEADRQKMRRKEEYFLDKLGLVRE